MVKITTNGHARDVLEHHELPAHIRDVVEDTAGAHVRVYGNYYPLNEFERIYRRGQAVPPFAFQTDESALLKWDGIMTIGAFAAIVVRYLREYDEWDPSRAVVGWVTFE